MMEMGSPPNQTYTLALPGVVFQPHTSNHLWTKNMSSAPTISLGSSKPSATRELADITHGKLMFWLACSSCLCQCETRAEQSEETDWECTEQQKQKATFSPQNNSDNRSISYLHRALIYPSFSPPVISCNSSYRTLSPGQSWIPVTRCIAPPWKPLQHS